MSPRLAEIRASNEEKLSSLPGSPVAVFVGGTSGVGQGMAEVFARHRGGKAHIVIVGRNEKAAREIISKFPKPSDGEGWSHEFVQCDATLMANVVRASQEILSRHPKINFLAMSSGVFTADARSETPEGIDKKLAGHYYARWKFVRELSPALAKAKENGEEARVLSVLLAGQGGPIDVEDLGLKKGYSLAAASRTASTYTDYMIESFSKRYPGLTFAHSNPGIVMTNIMTGARSPWIRAAAPLVMFLARPFAVSIQECGEYMWSGVLKGADSGGSYRFNDKGEVLSGVQHSGDEEVRKQVWVHTEEITTVKNI